MKPIVLFICVLFALSCQSQNESLVVNVSGKKIDLNKEYTETSIEKVFGKPVNIKRESDYDDYVKDESDAPPWTVITYDGLSISLIGSDIEEIIITNDSWSINGITINDDFEKIKKTYKFIDMWKDYHRFLYGNTDVILFVKIKNDKILELGIGVPLL